MHDTDLHVCAHLTVEFEPFMCEDCGEAHGSWECALCGEEFVQAGLADEMAESHDRLVDALRSAVEENNRLRGAAILGCVFILGMLVARP